MSNAIDIKKVQNHLYLNRTKVFLLGFLVFFSKSLFFSLGSCWFEELRERSKYEKQVDILRKNFWRSFFLIIAVVGGTVLYLIQTERASFDIILSMRLIAIILALTAALGRGGWAIQTWSGETIIERIDRGLYTVSQLGATILLLFTLTMR